VTVISRNAVLQWYNGINCTAGRPITSCTSTSSSGSTAQYSKYQILYHHRVPEVPENDNGRSGISGILLPVTGRGKYLKRSGYFMMLLLILITKKLTPFSIVNFIIGPQIHIWQRIEKAIIA
jgi:hypothetical protein